MNAITYIHRTHPRSRSLKIKIEPSGQVVVVTPRRYSQSTIDRFVAEHSEWITATQNQLATRRAKGENDQELYVFGERYQKKITHDPTLSLGCQLQERSIVINLPHLDSTSLDVEKSSTAQVTRFLKATAEKYIVPRTYQIAALMNITFGTITLRQQKSRWGSCSSQGNLNFNWRLIHAPTEVIDYVIVHELAHRRHLNHSRAFWNLVSEYDPEHALHRGWLKRHGMSVT